MSELKINEFKECQKCGECCKTPCDIIPSDLPKILNDFNMSFKTFFKKYLIALLIASPKYADEVLMMVPVKVDSNGNRTTKLLADNEYLNFEGKCIFLNNSKCSIHKNKPYGGKFLLCSKITGSVSIQLSKSQYFAYWAINQHLFEKVVPGYINIHKKLKIIFQKKNDIYKKQGKTKDYDKLHNQQMKIISQELFPLFNGRGPINGFKILT